MQYPTTLAAVLAACIANVAAQSFSNLPPCAQSCATNAIPSSCGLNVGCICNTSSFITDVSCCIATACDSADQETTIKFADEICSVAGVTNLPTSAVCSSSAAASATSASASASASTSMSASTSAGTAMTTASAASGTPTTSASASSAVIKSSSAVSVTSKSSTTASSSASAATSSKTGAAAIIKIDGPFAVGAGAAACLAAMYLA